MSSTLIELQSRPFDLTRYFDKYGVVDPAFQVQIKDAIENLGQRQLRPIVVDDLVRACVEFTEWCKTPRKKGEVYKFKLAT